MCECTSGTCSWCIYKASLKSKTTVHIMGSGGAGGNEVALPNIVETYARTGQGVCGGFLGPASPLSKNESYESTTEQLLQQISSQLSSVLLRLDAIDARLASSAQKAVSALIEEQPRNSCAPVGLPCAPPDEL